MKKETFTLFTFENNKKRYVYEISRTNVYMSEDRETAIKFDSRELAYMLRDYLNRRAINTKYFISCIVIEELVLDEETEETEKEN